MRAVLLVSHRREEISVVARAADGSGWEPRVYRRGETLVLDDPDLSLNVDEIYAGIPLEPA